MDYKIEDLQKYCNYHRIDENNVNKFEILTFIESNHEWIIQK